jgi:hypothetical protein
MISGRGPPTRLPDARPHAELACAARPGRRGEGRRDPGAASRGHRSTPTQPAPKAELGRPRPAQRAEPAPTGRSATAAACVAENAAALARPAGRPPVDLPATTTGPATVAQPVRALVLRLARENPRWSVRWRGPVISTWSRHSRRSVPMKRSAIALARGWCFRSTSSTTTPIARTARCISSRPQAPLPHPPMLHSSRCDEIDSAVSYTSTCRSHDVTVFSAPTRTSRTDRPNPDLRRAAPAGRLAQFGANYNERRPH